MEYWRAARVGRALVRRTEVASNPDPGERSPGAKDSADEYGRQDPKGYGDDERQFRPRHGKSLHHADAFGYRSGDTDHVPNHTQTNDDPHNDEANAHRPKQSAPSGSVARHSR